MAFSTRFEATFSPVNRRKSDETDDIAVLNFRPFSSAPKIVFKNVVTGQRVVKPLLLRNPQDETIEIEFAKLPPPDVGITFSCDSLKLRAREEYLMEVYWQPTKEGKCIHSVHLKTNTNSRFFFSIVCVSVPKKALKKRNSTQIPKSQKIVLKGFSGQISQKRTTDGFRESALPDSFGSKLSTQINVGSSCKIEQHKSLGAAVTHAIPSAKTGIEDLLLPADDKLISEEELLNLSSETYDIVSPASKDLNIKETEIMTTLSQTSTYTRLPKNEENIFSDFTFSPLRSVSSFQKRDEVSRETFCLPSQNIFLPVGQLSPISYVKSSISYTSETENISEDSLSPITPALDRKMQCSVLGISPLDCNPVQSSVLGDFHDNSKCDSKVYKSEITFDFNLSSVQSYAIPELDISGISEMEEELKNRFSDDRSTFDISLPHFTPLQITKFAPSDTTKDEMPLENIKSTKNVSNIKRDILSEIYNSQDSLHDIEKTVAANYFTFSPPQTCHNRAKENTSPQTATSMASRTFKKPFPNKIHPIQNSVSKKKDAFKQTKRKTCKEIKYAIPKLILNSKRKENKESVLMDTEKFLSEQANPSYCITATINNPFINSAVFYDQKWFDEREKEFVRWLNVLLTPPEQLNSNDELPRVDVAELWKKCCKSEVAPAPSRETVSSLYLVNHRLDSLRRKACTMFRLPCVAEVLSKVTVQIEKGLLSMRKDRNFRDIGLKYSTIELLLCYNPLWLRIGLETIMGRTIPLDSNSDIVGIAGFIARNILSDPYLVQQYSISGVTKMFKPGYDEAIKKHILKKFFLLVFFLDYAKENKLIIHNPCLFCKDAKYKESRDLLLAFARDFLSGIGDVTKHLRTLGYVVKHKQTYLDEYNYAVTHLGSDLRDGVRLVKVTEIILQDSSVSSCLRTPAISKLQKMHNVKVALSALKRAGHIVQGDISAKDIVEGHKEKTMSLLWQIIHKFQLSRFTIATNRIQKWYRSLPICIKRRIYMRKIMAKRREEEERASVVIQKYWRGYIAYKFYKILKGKQDYQRKFQNSAVVIQRWFRFARVMKRNRSQFLLKKRSVISIQRWYRNVIISRTQRKDYLRQKETALIIQKWYRRALLCRRQRNVYMLTKQAVLKVQTWFRACCAMKKQREKYQRQLKAIHKIQTSFKALKLMKSDRQTFMKTRNCATIIQVWYRSIVLMRKQRQWYLHTLKCVINFQLRFRSTKLMKRQREIYVKQRNSAVLIQRKFRANHIGQQQKYLYDVQKRSIVKLQIWYRSILMMRMQQKIYLQKKMAIITIQQKLRAVILGERQRNAYLLKRNAALVIQRWYRQQKKMLQDLCVYERNRTAVKNIQTWFRSIILMRQQRAHYLEIRKSVIKIQSWFRVVKLGKEQRKHFLQQCHAVLLIQCKFRAKRLGQKQKRLYVLQRQSVVKIQRWYRSSCSMKLQREQFLKEKSAVLFIQRKFRATLLAKEQKKVYVSQRTAVIKIQVWYRACVSMKCQRNMYIGQKNAACKIQTYFRALKLLQIDRTSFKKRRMAATRVQVWFRCCILMRQQREYYLKVRSCTLKIQIWFRARYLMIQQRNLYLKQRKAALIIQQKFRATLLCRRQIHQYDLVKKSTLIIQRWFRNVWLQRKLYLEAQQTSVDLQSHSDSWVLSERPERISEMTCASSDITRKLAANTIGQWYHSILLKRKQSEEKRKLALQAALDAFATRIQAYWRGYKVRKELKDSALCSNIKSANSYTLDEGFSLRSLYHKGIRTFNWSSTYAVTQSAALLIECGVRLSREICEEFLLSSHLDTLIYLLETMNRSVPAEKLLIILLKILMHILRHPMGTAVILEKEKTIPILLNLTNIWCAKRYEELFRYFCTVWWLLGHDEGAVLIIRRNNDMSTQLLKFCMKALTWNTQNLRTSVNTSRYLPHITPSWSIVKHSRPKIFENAKFAVIQVTKKFGMQLN